MRVIAGRLGGRRFDAPSGRATRPTTDRVREALFAVLGELDDARVADLYAGSGALGIEALSRGAAHATFVESSRAALTVLRSNLRQLGLEARSRVIASPVERAGPALAAAGPFDLTFADPPWQNLQAAIAALQRALSAVPPAPGARLALEHPAREPSPECPGWELLDLRRWGDTAVSLYTVVEKSR